MIRNLVVGHDGYIIYCTPISLFLRNNVHWTKNSNAVEISTTNKFMIPFLDMNRINSFYVRMSHDQQTRNEH